jgi:tryptophan-rich sensory protein
MKINWKKLLICLAIPLAVGGLGALLSGGMSDYGAMVKPPLSPPGWVFPIAWSILYLLMGYASYRILESDASKEEIKKALFLYGIQLLANFIWPLLFFGGGWFLLSFFWLILMWVLIYLTIRAFSKIDETAGNLLIPYILWVTFAAYLNFGIYLLNL